MPELSGETLVTECLRHSIALLRRNSTPAGIMAATRTAQAAGRQYTCIFGRDAAICALGMAASGEGDLIEAAAAGLRTLAANQAGNGQIPKYVKPETGEVDFWYAGCIDATLWWLIAVRLHDRLVPGATLGREFSAHIERALQWLSCQEHQVWHLLQQNEASDWADIMPRSGFVLYSNALWYWVKRLYQLPGADISRDYANFLFFPAGTSVCEQRRVRLMTHYIRKQAVRQDVYLSFVNFSFWGEEVDVFGNLLACLTGLADSSRAGQIVRYLRGLGIDRPWPVRVVGTPIERDDPMWRRYMSRHKQNLPYQYHNGGIWPFVGGFWVMLLGQLGMARQAADELSRLAAVNRAGNWEFNEWLHGRTGRPSGMPGQSWNAAMFVLAERCLGRRLRLFR